MASDQEWRDKLETVLKERIPRRDVELAVSVQADPGYPLEDFDEEEFAAWAADWVDFTVSTSGGPVMPGTSETEWTTGDNDEVRVKLLLLKR